MNKISIIIPTLNRQNYLLNTVNYLNLQSFKNFEIIIIDQNKPYNLNFYKYLKIKYKNLKIKILKQEKKMLVRPETLERNMQKMKYYYF